MSRSNSNDIINFIKNVIDKKFTVVSKGYDPKSVDATLDEIIHNFQQYIELFERESENNLELKKENQDLNKKIQDLTNMNTNLRTQVEKFEKSGYSASIINERLSSLEKKQQK